MKSISFRLTAAMLAVSFVGMGLLFAITSIFTAKSLLQESLDLMQEKTTSSAEQINSWLDEQMTYFTAISHDLANLSGFTRDELFSLLKSHLENNPAFFDVYIGYPDGTALFASEWTPAPDWVPHERDWYQSAAQNPTQSQITKPYTDAMTGDLCLSISHAIYSDDTLKGVLSNDMYAKVLSDIVFSTSTGENSYAFLIDSEGSILLHPNKSYAPDSEDNFQNLGTIENGLYLPALNLKDERVPFKVHNIDKTDHYVASAPIAATGWYLYTSIPASVIHAPVYHQMIVSIIVLVITLLVAAFLIYFMLKRIVVRPVTDITIAALKLTNGDIDMSLSNNYLCEFSILADSFTNVASCIRQQASLLHTLLEGDYTVSIPVRSDRDVINQAMNEMIHGNHEMLSDIRTSASLVASASQQIAQASQSLAAGAIQQNESIERSSSGIDDVRTMAEENVKIADAAIKSVQSSTGFMSECSTAMQQMLASMHSIDEKSKDISKVIKVIDDIAFQTNILALNAAVEAARAGQHGKGFSVVAEEVRNLASKSAQAAKETAGLIEGSLQSVKEGNDIVERVSGSLQAVNANSDANAQFITDLHSSSQKQSREIAEIASSISQILDIVRSTSATAEEMAASAQEMSAQSSTLDQIVSRFKLQD